MSDVPRDEIPRHTIEISVYKRTASHGSTSIFPKDEHRWEDGRCTRETLNTMKRNTAVIMMIAKFYDGTGTGAGAVNGNDNNYGTHGLDTVGHVPCHFK